MLSNRLTSDQLRLALVNPGFVTDDEFRQVLAESSHSGKSPGQIILERSHLTSKELTKVVADFLQQKFVDLSQAQIVPEILEEIPQLYAQEHQVVAFARDDQGLSVAMVDPLDQAVVDHLQKSFRFSPKFIIQN
jgi:hypothetical protein